jgi:N,N-dimethylformamidase
MLKITGYADRIYCRPGDTIKFMVNCEHPSYQAEMVRIICGDDNPKGPGVKEEPIDVPFAATYPGRRQEIQRKADSSRPKRPVTDVCYGQT